MACSKPCESHSLGSFELRFSPEECQLIIAPAVPEMVGGAEDGEEVFPFFSIHLAELAKAFDALPMARWIMLQKLPFNDDVQPRWLLEEGVLRRRSDGDE